MEKFKDSLLGSIFIIFGLIALVYAIMWADSGVILYGDWKQRERDFFIIACRYCLVVGVAMGFLYYLFSDEYD